MRAALPQRSAANATALAGAATVACLMPAFLVGALGVSLTEELAFGAGGLGIAVAAYRVTAALMSPVAGKLVDRMGASSSLRVAALIATATCVGILTTVRSWSTLVVWLAIGGLAHAVEQPAANRLLSRVVRPERLGIAFGLKQSAPPAASMLAGISVPLVALTLGWRYTYAIAAVFATAIVVLARPRGRSGMPRRDPRTQPQSPATHQGVVFFAVAFGLGNIASMSVATFYVVAAVAGGIAEGTAGTVFAVAGLSAVGVRIVSGYLSDRMAHGHLRLCGALLGIGTMGIVLLIWGQSPSSIIGGGIVALAGTWGSNGVFWYAMIRMRPDDPGAITGQLAPGGLLGSILGPIIFGLIVDAFGLGAAWTFAGTSALLAMTMLFIGSSDRA